MWNRTEIDLKHYNNGCYRVYACGYPCYVGLLYNYYTIVSPGLQVPKNFKILIYPYSLAL